MVGKSRKHIELGCSVLGFFKKGLFESNFKVHGRKQATLFKWVRSPKKQVGLMQGAHNKFILLGMAR